MMTTRNPTSSTAPRYTKPSRAKLRWHAAFGKILAERSLNKSEHEAQPESGGLGLIAEIKRAKDDRSRMKEGVLTLLKSETSPTEKVFERHKSSAKEILNRRRARSRKIDAPEEESRVSVADYDVQAKLRYTITPEIRIKLDKIKEANDNADEAHAKKAGKKPGFLESLFQSTILGQILKANPRFYKLDPLAHLPTLCRRCRRPLAETLESKFTSIGILFCILFPIIGIFMLFANKEFVCVICNEIYVYGDLTARPEEDYGSEDENDGPK